LIRYFDSSALVKRYVDEPQGEEVARLLADAIPATSRLSEVEITSAILRRWRQGDLSADERDRALAALRQDLMAMNVVELAPEVSALATKLLERHDLRAGDAVQLASSAYLQKKVGRKIELVAFDRRLVEAAAREGLTPAMPPL
jgi:predicted nucleic acid-binding protein